MTKDLRHFLCKCCFHDLKVSSEMRCEDDNNSEAQSECKKQSIMQVNNPEDVEQMFVKPLQNIS
ncbi:CLUMA_CG021459, isoform A [Clunio marinus]|uniref:CLUMA_CG021459, isoform A n=1 Tax=Clunio marinus TaxID=568069 RepID=A0A1J1J7P2_9DIPT|nr:CLUMA_CG021459, isoform A [Clunio marinus]